MTNITPPSPSQRPPLHRSILFHWDGTHLPICDLCFNKLPAAEREGRGARPCGWVPPQTKRCTCFWCGVEGVVDEKDEQLVARFMTFLHLVSSERLEEIVARVRGDTPLTLRQFYASAYGGNPDQDVPIWVDLLHRGTLLRQLMTPPAQPPRDHA